MNVVFDFGAVLFEWQPAQLLREYLPAHASDEASARALARAVFHHADWLAFDQGLLDLPEVHQRTVQRLGLPAEELGALLGDIGERLRPMAASVAVLDQLRAQRDAGLAQDPPPASRPLRLYYLSNMPAPYARELEQRHAFLQWFDGGVFSGDARLIKPDAAVYQQLAARHGLLAEDTLFIDDLPANVAMARSLGWAAIQFQDAAQLRAELGRHGLI